MKAAQTMLQVRIALAVTVALAALGAASVVQAGPASTDSNGNFLMIDVDVTPPRAASGATLRYHAFFGNRQGEVLPREAANRIRLARGFRLRGRAFPKCPLPRDSSEFGQDRCSQRTKVGEGTFEADARPVLSEPVTGTFEIFNGALHRGNTTLILLAEAQVGDSTVNSELNYQYVGSMLRTLPPPEGTPTGLLTVTRTSLRIGARHRGTGYVRTPRRCRGSWSFGEVVFFEGGGAINARDAVSCVRRNR